MADAKTATSAAKTAKSSPAAAAKSPPAAAKRRGPKTKNEACEHFSRHLRILATDLATHFPEDAKVAKIHRQAVLAVAEFPVDIIESVGAYLSNYAGQIWGRDVAFFAKKDFKQEIDAGVIEEKIEAVQYLMPLLKDKFLKLTEPQKNEYMDIVIEMLDAYIVYKGGCIA